MNEPLNRREALRLGAGVGMSASMALGQLACSQGPEVQTMAEGKPPALGPKGQIRAAWIGVGGRGTGVLKDALKVENFKIIGICDINPEHANRAVGLVEKAQGHKPDTYINGPEDYKRLLAREDLDAVYMATPCDLHAGMFLDTIAADKHIYGEKPMGLTVQELDDVTNAAKRKPYLTVQLGFQWMSNAQFLDSAERIHQGEIGELVEGRFRRHNTVPPLFRWFGIRKHSGDWMVEQACHELNVLNWISKSTPIRCFALGRRDLFTDQQPERDITDYHATILEYPNNFIVHYDHNWYSPKGFGGMEMKVVGTKGALDIWGRKLAYRDAKKPAVEIKAQQGSDTLSHLKTFANCIHESKQPLANVEYGRKACLVGLLIRKAVDIGGEVSWDQMLRTC